MKKKLSSKKCIAVVLAAIMIITSIPFAFAGVLQTGDYNPAPYWGDGTTNSAVNTKFIATLNQDGSVSVSFPKANVSTDYLGNATKSITNYIFTLTKLADDGTRVVLWSENFNLSDTSTAAGIFTVAEGAEYPNNIFYAAGGLVGLEGYDASANYDVAIQAVDSDGWVSDKIHTLLSDLPYYDITADFSPNEAWVVREMLLFEAASSANVSEGDNTTSGAGVDVNGQTAGVGYNKTAGYRFWINGAYSQPFTAQTTWSRVHYDFNNAEEVWFYVDFTRVNIGKVAFTLSANEKSFDHYRDNTYKNEASHYGDAFSTAAVAGKNAGTVSEGIYIQNADGLWESTSMTDGYFTNLSGYEGFVRIPIEYFVLQNDQYLNTRPLLTSWEDSGYFDASDCNSFAGSADNLNTYISSVQLKAGDKIVFTDTNRTVTASAGSALINAAGTCVTDAVILYDRYETYGTEDSIFAGTTIGGLSTYTQSVTDSVATITVSDPCYAIEDMVSAGITVANWSENSVHKAFYIDQVMFCMKDTGATYDASTGNVLAESTVKFPAEGGDFADDYGKRMSGYYDRTVKVPEAVSGYVEEYFGDIPSLNDINAKLRIDAIITEYIDCFPGCTTIEQAITLLSSEAQTKYNAAVKFINDYAGGGLDVTTSAVKAFEDGVQNLPDVAHADRNDTELQTDLKELMALYRSFNLSHFELLGKDAEERFLEIYNIVMGEDVKTGKSIGAYPYIPFNDFETNYSYGQLSEFYYDDYPARENSKATDINSTHNFVSWVSNNRLDQMGEVGGTARGWSPQDFRPSGETFSDDTYLSRMDAIISNNGFDDSLGATIRLHGELNSLNNNWKLATLSTTYLGQTGVANWGELKGLDLSPLAVNTEIDTSTSSTVTFDEQNKTRYGEGVIANSFVMYVDFTDVTDINMNIKFIVSDANGTDYNCYFCGGAEDRYPIIYLLDENGNWEEQNLEITQTDIDASSSLIRDTAPVTCSISPSSKNTLEGYKGFIRIPLTNFRIPTTSGIGNLNVDYVCFDDVLDEYTIKQAKITFWDEHGGNVDKEIHIDAMGFTYDPSCTTRTNGYTNVNSQLNGLNGITVTNMDEYFGVKTNDSVNFEQMVAVLDPYDTGDDDADGTINFIENYDACLSAYSALSNYQKNIYEVKNCYENLLKGKYQALRQNYDTVIATDEWAPLYTSDDPSAELVAGLANVSDTAKSYIKTSETVLDVWEKSGGDHYANSYLGIASAEEAQNIVDIYEKGYMRMNKTEQAEVEADTANFTALENAYSAARRALELDKILADADSFTGEITGIYLRSTHPDENADRIEEATNEKTFMVSYEATTTDEDGATVNSLQNAITHYEDMSIYSKIILGEDTGTERYALMYDAVEAISDNSTTTNVFHGSAVEGGIVTFEKRLQAAYTEVSEKITAQTVLDSTILNEVEYCLGQYEALLPRYAQVDELNYAYAELALLLPAAEIANATTQVVLTNATDNEVYSYTTDVDLSYVAARLNRTVSVYLVTDYKWTQTSGTTYDFGYYTVNGATGTDGTVAYTKLGDYANGVTAEINPIISVDETAAKNVPTGAQYSGTVKVVAFDSSSITDGVDVSTLTPIKEIEIPVVFSSVNGTDPLVYTVTIPAVVQVDWDDASEKSVSYSVEATLGSNELSVSVVDSGAEAGKLYEATGTHSLDFTTTNFKETTFTGTVATGTKPTDEPSITIQGWDLVPVGTYSTQLTYTVGVTS